MTPPVPPGCRPADPRFATGPARKRPGWRPSVLAGAPVGRSHRSGDSRARLQRVVTRSRAILGIPDSYYVGILPGSDTGAVEALLWNLLGPRGVDVLAWDGFSRTWLRDVRDELGLADVRALTAPDGDLPALSAADPARDVVFPWVGTTTGAMVPDGTWIDAARTGLTICDATSAVFAVDLPWRKLDAVTWSWQKMLGGEAQHGMVALSPRAAERLAWHTPPWPVPKLFRLADAGGLKAGIFSGRPINTPSMLCVEDALDGLAWAEAIGGLPELIRRARANRATVAAWAGTRAWVDFLARDPATRAPTSICLTFADPAVCARPEADRRALARRMAAVIADRGAGFDLEGHRDAPPSLRLWGGATVDRADIAAVLPWLDWAFAAATNAPAGPSAAY